MATLTIENVDLAMIENQRKELASIDVEKLPQRTYEALISIQVMLDYWADKDYRFVTFGFDHKVAGVNLANHYMVVTLDQELKMREDQQATPFAFSYPLSELRHQVEDYDIKEITWLEYHTLRTGEWGG